MTPTQLKTKSTKDLLIAYKNKARCIYTESKAEAIFKELQSRLGAETLSDLSRETWHMQHGEGYKLFNDECDKLISKYE